MPDRQSLTRNRVVTVFGGDGFIGRTLIYKLARTGATIRVASRNPHKALQAQPAGVVGQIVPLPTDITNEADIRRALDGATDAVNLVGVLVDRSRNSFFRVHAEAPGVIGRVATELGLGSLVHLSAIGAAEDALSGYGRSKFAGEQALRAAYPGAVILRPSIVFGPGDGFFTLFASLARFTPVLPLIGGGETKFQPVYVVDVADAIMEGLMDRGKTAGKTYELGGPVAYSFRELLELMLKETGRKRSFVTLPWGLAEKKGKILQLLPNPMLTYDQVQSLKTDNLVADDALTLEDLGIESTPVEFILPTYLWRFRPLGRFGKRLDPEQPTPQE